MLNRRTFVRQATMTTGAILLSPLIKAAENNPAPEIKISLAQWSLHLSADSLFAWLAARWLHSRCHPLPQLLLQAPRDVDPPGFLLDSHDSCRYPLRYPCIWSAAHARRGRSRRVAMAVLDRRFDHIARRCDCIRSHACVTYSHSWLASRKERLVLRARGEDHGQSHHSGGSKQR